MKRLICLALALVMVLALVACGSAGGTKMTMGTGGTSGTYYAFGGVLGQYIKNNAGIDVTVVSTDGSKANILGIHAGNYQLATVQSDVMAYACAGTRSFERWQHLERECRIRRRIYIIDYSHIFFTFTKDTTSPFIINTKIMQGNWSSK